MKYLILIVLTFCVILGLGIDSIAQTRLVELGKVISDISFQMPSDLGDRDSIKYSFINAGCHCSISQAITGKKENRNSIITFSFNLSQINDGMIIISKPTDSDFNEITEDIWTIEIGRMETLVQSTQWQSRQTLTTHLYFHIIGKENLDQVIELFKESVTACGGSINKIVGQQ